MIGQISSADLLPDGSIVVSTTDPPRVFLFNPSGDRVRTIGRSGSGPFEYGSPSLVRATDDRIAIWDESALKLMLFTHEGTGVDEWTGFSRALSNFQMVGDTVVTYGSGGIREEYIRAFDLSGGERTDVFSTGSAPIEHTLLMMLEGSGSVSVSGDSVYYVSPASPYIYSANIAGDAHSTDRLLVSDGDFDVEDSGFSSIQDINANQREAVVFATSNSADSIKSALPHTASCGHATRLGEPRPEVVDRRV